MSAQRRVASMEQVSVRRHPVRTTMVARQCAACGRVGFDVLAATAMRGAECMSSSACVIRAERRGR